MNKQIRVLCVVAEKDGKYLITQRRRTAAMPLMWEFPGGRAEEGEADEDALRRELRERLGAEFTIGIKLGEKVHSYDHQDVVLALYAGKLVEGQQLGCQRVESFLWVAPSELGFYQFPDADQSLKAYLPEAPRT